MLQNLHVKNLALIDEAEVDFSGGLNILTYTLHFVDTGEWTGFYFVGR